MARTVVLTIGDSMVDFDAPYVAVVPAIFQDIFGPHIGKKIGGIEIVVPTEAMIRAAHCSGKSLDAILGSCLYAMGEKIPRRFVDSDACLAAMLGITDAQADAVVLDDEARKNILRHIDLEIFNGDENAALRGERRDILVRQALRGPQGRMDGEIAGWLDRNGPFMPGTAAMVDALIDTGCDVKAIFIADQKSADAFPRDIKQAVLDQTKIDPRNVLRVGLQYLERKDVKDLFPDLDKARERDIMVFTNHVGLLLCSTVKDLSSTDDLYAETFGGAAASRRKKAPYHVCMIGYNKSCPADRVPSSVRERNILTAASPAEVLSHAGVFAAGELVRSFSPAPGAKAQGEGAGVIAFPDRKK